MIWIFLPLKQRQNYVIKRSRRKKCKTRIFSTVGRKQAVSNHDMADQFNNSKSKLGKYL